MPTIPGYERSVVGGSGGGVVRGTRLDGGADLLNEVADDFRKEAEKKDRLDVSRARNRLLMLKAEQDSAYDDDEEFETIGERYRATMDEGLASAGLMIENPELREQFLLENEVVVEQGKQRIHDIAVEKGKDRERGDIGQEIQYLATAAEQDGGDPTQIYASVRERLQSAAERDVISFEDAQRIGDEFRVNVSVNKLKALGAADRLDALKADWAGNIPQHLLTQLRQEAQDELRLGKAQRLAQKAVDSGLSRTEAEFSFRGQKPELYRDTMAQFDYLYSSRKADETEERGEAYTQLWESMNPAEGEGFSLSELRTGEWGHTLWAKLTKPERDNLYQLEQQKLSGSRQYSDRGVWIEMQRRAATAKESRAARASFHEYYMENSAKLNNRDFQHFGGILFDERDDLIGVSQLLSEYTKAITNQEEINTIYSGVLDWHESQTRRNDNIPPAYEETRKMVEFYSNKLPGSAFFNEDRPASVEDMDSLIDAYFDPDNLDNRDRIKQTLTEDKDLEEFEVKVFEKAEPEEYKFFLQLLREKSIPVDHLNYRQLHYFMRVYQAELSRASE